MVTPWKVWDCGGLDADEVDSLNAGDNNLYQKIGWVESISRALKQSSRVTLSMYGWIRTMHALYH